MCITSLEHLSFSFLQKNYCYNVKCDATTSGPNDCIKKIIKKEGGNSLSLNARGFTTPLYTKVPELFNDIGTCSFSRRDFVEKYDLCCLGMSPKHIKILKDCMKKEIDKCFGLVVNKNGHRYIECLDPKLIAKVGKLWMIMHQKPYVLAFRLITLGMARGIVCEEKASN